MKCAVDEDELLLHLPSQKMANKLHFLQYSMPFEGHTSSGFVLCSKLQVEEEKRSQVRQTFVSKFDTLVLTVSLTVEVVEVQDERMRME